MLCHSQRSAKTLLPQATTEAECIGLTCTAFCYGCFTRHEANFGWSGIAKALLKLQEGGMQRWMGHKIEREAG